MEHSTCRVIYIDDRFKSERWIQRDAGASGARSRTSDILDDPELANNVQAILSVFSQGKDCATLPGLRFSVSNPEYRGH